MSNDSETPADKPRTWLPIAGAGAAGAIVIIIAFWATVFGQGLSQIEQDTIAACEAEYARSGGTPIAAGDVYEPDEMRDYYAFAEIHGEVPTPLAEVPVEVTDEWDAAAARYVDGGGGLVMLVWRLENDKYAQCAATVSQGAVDKDSVVVGPFVAAGAE